MHAVRAFLLCYGLVASVTVNQFCGIWVFLFVTFQISTVFEMLIFDSQSCVFENVLEKCLRQKKSRLAGWGEGGVGVGLNPNLQIPVECSISAIGATMYWLSFKLVSHFNLSLEKNN